MEICYEQIRYERSLSQAVMILPASQDGEEKFFRKMILENRIRCFVPVRLSETGNGPEYRYRISGLVSLEEYLEHDFLREEFLKQLIFTLCRCSKELEEYLLAEDCLLVKSCAVFVAQGCEPEFLFCLYPDGEQDVRQDIHDLLKYLMGKTDPTDEKCAALCYRLYGLLQKENFYLGEFMAALEEAGEEREVPSETEKKKWTKQLFAGRRNSAIIKSVRR